MKPFDSDSQTERRRIVARAVAVTTNISLAPQRYERQLLNRYQRGELTIDQVISLLDSSVYQVLYRSVAVRPWEEVELKATLEQSRSFNVQDGLTGILLYSDGRFVQLLEGDKQQVRTLYARIQHD